MIFFWVFGDNMGVDANSLLFIRCNVVMLKTV